MMIDERNPGERPGIDGLVPVNREAEPYDATRDPRTGRPPNPLEAQRLAREREARSAAEPDGASDEGDGDAPRMPEDQEPGRMTSLTDDKEEKGAADALVQQGVARERAEELVREHGPNLETLKAAAFASEHADLRKEAPPRHHEEGVRPVERPERQD